MDELLELHDAKTLEMMLSDFVALTFSRLDDELDELQNMVDGNDYSMHEISDKISEIRAKIY